MKRFNVWIFSGIVLILSWLLWYLTLFQNIDFRFELFGFSFDVVAMIPGILAFILFKSNHKDKLLPYFANFGKKSYWFIGICYPMIAVALTICIGYLFKSIKFADVKNVETLILGIVLDYPLMLLWSIPTLLFIEFGWRVFFFRKTAESTSILKGILFSSFVWMLSYIIFIIGTDHKTVVGFENIPYLVSIFTSGLIICWLYLRSNSIWVIIFFHFNWILWNNFFFGDPLLQNDGIFIGKYWLVNMKGITGALLNLSFIFLYISDVKNGKITLQSQNKNP